MKTILILSATLAVALAAQICYFPTGPTPQARPITGCSWYATSTCCTVEDDQNIASGWESGAGNPNATVNKVFNTLTGCLDLAHLYACMPCSPAQDNFIKPSIATLFTGTVTINVCQSYCDKLYQACGRVKGSDGQAFNAKYSTSAAFCTGELGSGSGNKIAVETSNSNCFNAAPTLSAPFALVLAMLVLTFFGMY